MRCLIVALFWLSALMLVACNAPIAAREIEEVQSTPVTPGPLPQTPPDSCPITQPQNPIFVPPEPYAPTAPYEQFWYGANGLWTALQPDGRWYALPHDEHGYSQKVFWWREGYDMTKEQQPLITISGRRLDGDAPTFEHTGGTSGHHDDMGQFMLTGVAIPTAGCWEITGRYNDQSLSFVVWVSQ